MYDQKLIDAIQKAWHAYIADSENLPADLLNMDKKALNNAGIEQIQHYLSIADDAQYNRFKHAFLHQEPAFSDRDLTHFVFNEMRPRQSRILPFENQWNSNPKSPFKKRRPDDISNLDEASSRRPQKR